MVGASAWEEERQIYDAITIRMVFFECFYHSKVSKKLTKIVEENFLVKKRYNVLKTILKIPNLIGNRLSNLLTHPVMSSYVWVVGGHLGLCRFCALFTFATGFYPYGVQY